MVREIIDKSVINGNIYWKMREFDENRGMPDRVKGFREIKRNDTDILVRSKRICDVENNRDEGCLGRACGTVSKLVRKQG